MVEQLDITALSARKGRSANGRRAYDPRMLLTLLIYAYACGLRSSRAIEARCRVDVSFRLVCANTVPDHSTISRFRRSFGLADGVIEEVFTQVLAVCALAGLGRLEYVAADGTKINTNAARDANRTEDGCRALARKALTEAAGCDTGTVALAGIDLTATVELTGAWARPQSRAARIGRCLAELQAQHHAQEFATGPQPEQSQQIKKNPRPTSLSEGE
ncbi:transposase [Streptosporangium sp. NPDC087985]|uniref:transposase n=1 Tax=Streptosporangium sp. NPDC087985 TaxID=3366196 RepID=UPI00381C22E5